MKLKRMATLGLCICMAFTMTACGSKKKTNTEKKETKNKITLADYSVVKAYSKEAEVTDSDIQETLDNLMDKYSTQKTVTEGKVKRGDVITIDYVGKIDGVAFEGGTASDQEITLGYSGYIDGFDKGLEGKKLGETVDLNLKFPDNYQKEELKGKDCVFTVTLKNKKEKETPELNDKFVEEKLKSFYDVTTVDELKEFMKNKVRLSRISKAIWQDYVDACVAESYNTKEVDDLVKEMATYYESVYQSQYQVDLATYLKAMNQTEDQWKKSLEEDAKKQLKEKMVVNEIAKKEKLINDDIYKKTGLIYCQSYSVDSIEELEKQFGKDKVEYVIKYTIVTEWLADNVEIVEGERPTEANTETGSGLNSTENNTETETESKKGSKKKSDKETETETETETEKEAASTETESQTETESK